MFDFSIFGLSLSEAYVILKPLALFIIGMTIYCIFVYTFYKFVSKRDIFGGNKKGDVGTGARIFQYLFLYPVALFFWYIIFFTLILVLAESRTVESVMLMAMAVIAVIRVTSYYKQELSADLAKIMPLALLVIFLLDIKSFSLTTSLEAVKSIFTTDATLHILIYYFLFVILLEFILRIGHAIATSPISQSRVNILALRAEKKQAVKKFEQSK